MSLLSTGSADVGSHHGKGDRTDFTVVIAVYNEADNVGFVSDEVLSSLDGSASFELIFVDDGSTDDTAARLRALRQVDPRIRLMRLDRRCGKTAALVAGITAARGEWIVTMDGDGQNDPADLLPMIEAARSAQGTASGLAPLVAGVRARRHDPWSRRIATRVANGFRQAVLKDSCPDTGCGLKAFRRDAFLLLPKFEGMHRFLPALFQLYGYPLLCHPVSHRQRLAGRSKYTNLGRALVGIGDTLGVVWLRNRTHLPSRIIEE
ncbi:MAG: glycosyltransferase family 2 protein [Geminicoccaceae bacterium]